MQEEFTHVIDWTKVRTVEDVKNILKGLEFTFNPNKLPEVIKPYLESRVQ